MVKDALGIIAVIAGILLCTVFPFLPGGHDGLAVTVSAMGRAFGMVGLLLVPVGAIWLVSAFWSRLGAKQYALGVLALIAFALVWSLLSLVGLMESGLSLGLAMLALGVSMVGRLTRRLRTERSLGALPAYFLVVPIVVALVQWVMANPLTEFSRGRAIRNSAPLIADIERYRAAHGHYPISLLAVWRDYRPDVVGLERFQYEPHGDAYNLVFEQTSFVFGTREFVVYNPLDQQVMTSHTADLLEFTGDALQRRRGYYAVHDLPQPHWKRFLFD